MHSQRPNERKMLAIPALKVVAPTNKKRTVGRKANAKYRTREHLTEREVERLVEAAKDNRWGHRDSTMVLIAFRHGLRASELVDLRWEQVDLKGGVLHVRRVKQGTPVNASFDRARTACLASPRTGGGRITLRFCQRT